ncbi:MAG: SDR family NAD(P)-dependent oxidoreductase [Alphaproteobacteria bacterium]
MIELHKSIQGKRVLITGADGFIGSHLTEALASQGCHVTALSYYNSFDSFGWLDSIDQSLKGKIKSIRGDIRDPHFVFRLTENQDIIFHLAALIAIPHSYIAAQSYVDVNITGTLNILEAARLHQTPKIIHTSTSEVYGTALSTPINEDHPLQGQSPYAATKIGADALASAYALSHNVNVIILRPFNTYGPRQSERAVIPTVIRQAIDPTIDTIEIGDTSTERDFTYVSDTVNAFVAAGAATQLEVGTPYNTGTGRTICISHMIDIVRQITGTNKPVITNEKRHRPTTSEVRLLQADVSKFFSATNWQPSISVEDGLKYTIDWWNARMAKGQVRPSSQYMT